MKSLVLVPWYTVTEKGDRAIAELIFDSHTPTTVSKYAEEGETIAKTFKRPLFSLHKSRSVGALKEQRRRILFEISNTALRRYIKKTKELRAVENERRKREARARN